MDQIFDEMVNVNREAQMTWKFAVEIKDRGQPDSAGEIPGVEGKDSDIRVTRGRQKTLVSTKS